jgi:hypothetical protein
MSDREFDQHVFSLTVCDRYSRQAGFDLLCGNSSGRDNRAARIAHSSANAPCDLLSGSVQTCEQGDQDQRQRLRATHAFPHSSSRIKIDFAKLFLVAAFENTRENSPTD